MNATATPPAPAALTTTASVLLTKKQDHNKLSSFVDDTKGALLSSLYLRRDAMPLLADAKEVRVTIEIIA